VEPLARLCVSSRRLAARIADILARRLRYPESADTHGGFGEAHLDAGNKLLAIRNYEKSL